MPPAEGRGVAWSGVVARRRMRVISTLPKYPRVPEGTGGVLPTFCSMQKAACRLTDLPKNYVFLILISVRIILHAEAPFRVPGGTAAIVMIITVFVNVYFSRNSYICMAKKTGP